MTPLSQMHTANICVVGSLNRDLVVQTSVLPQAGQTILGGPFTTFAGGKGANQAVAAARAGAYVTMVGAVGDDSYGELLRTGLIAEGVDVVHILVRDQVATGVALITVDQAGHNTIVVAPGANMTLTPADIQQSAGIIRAADILLLQLEVPLPVVETAAALAHQSPTRVILNPAPAQPLSDNLLASIDVLIPNESEAATLTGIFPTDWDEAENAARALQQRGVPSVVITLGSRGALLLDGDTIARQNAYQVQSIDPTAAGDAFVGAFAVALAEGENVRTAVQWGAAAGALATTHLGAQPSLPLRTAIQALLKS